MRIGLAQINPTIGDLEGNVDLAVTAIRQATDQGAELVVLPEMVVPGYPPRDMLCDVSFVEATLDATDDLVQRCRELAPAVIGTISRSDHSPPGRPGLHNAALLAVGGRVETIQAKRLLPTYDVYFEDRWFEPGTSSEVFECASNRLGLLVCEDLWDEGYAVHPPEELVTAGARILIHISASPYRRGILSKRRRHAERSHSAIVSVNACGAQDELIFDGRSFALSPEGEMLTVLPACTPAVEVIDLEVHSSAAPELSPELETLFAALVTGVRDFANKNRLERAFLGLSGGIDSALVAVIARAALGPDRVHAIALPSRFTDPRSTDSARELAVTLGISFDVIPLHPMHDAAEASLDALLEGGTTAENIQARLRAMILMAHVNHHGGMLLNTSNKTELALGYSTLYGDMAGTLCPIADLNKSEIYELADWIDQHHFSIPRFIRERPPTAELRADQVDPFDYAKVAPAIDRMIADNQSNAVLQRSEHKRWQMGVVLKVSEKAFGSGRMIPITRR